MLSFHFPDARLLIPTQESLETLALKVTHLGIGAHQDDLEFMAYHGILSAHRSEHSLFAGITCTDGAGSARCGTLAHLTDEEMKALRIQEQEHAARIGEYAFMLQLLHPSSSIKQSSTRRHLIQDLLQVLTLMRPQVLYTHNPMDKHPTHLAVLMSVVEALRSLPIEQRPKSVLGCEGWRDLDWVPAPHKIILDVSQKEHLARALNGVFDSQISGGKRYDEAIMGRRRAHATFSQSHHVDEINFASLAVELRPMIDDEALSPVDFALQIVDDFKAEVKRQWHQIL